MCIVLCGCPCLVFIANICRPDRLINTKFVHKCRKAKNNNNNKRRDVGEERTTLLSIKNKLKPRRVEKYMFHWKTLENFQNSNGVGIIIDTEYLLKIYETKEDLH